MKNIKKYLRFLSGALFVVLISASCESYLDRTPESDISENDVYGNFRSFNGFVEQMYGCVVWPDQCGAWNKYLFADETLNNYTYAFDQGNYWGNETYFFGGNPMGDITKREARTRRIWEFAWYGINVANLALAKLEEPGLFKGTDEERDFLKGQALFFRGWFHFEICRFWGGMPYINRVINWEDPYDIPDNKRLNFKETALKMADDFRAAADLLPFHWQLTEIGKTNTDGNNADRINKFFALGYLGKALLYAASPMMHEESGAGNGTNYDADLCKQAADAFGELLNYADTKTMEDGSKIYELAILTPHTSQNPAAAQTQDGWAGLFYKRGWLRPGGKEVIMEPTIYDRTRIRNSTLGAISPSNLGLNSGTNADVPTYNLTLLFGDKNGNPINDPDLSTYDPADPWNPTKRDPRFAKTIAVNGDKIAAFSGKENVLKTYNGGFHRVDQNPPTVTGFYQKKFSGLAPDHSTTYAGNIMELIPYLRLADIYLMYAEAVLFSQGGSPKASAASVGVQNGYGMTAEEAFNMVRVRATKVPLNAKFTADNNVFFEEIVRERAVEFALEGQRFCDIRRWNRNGLYIDKTCADFDQASATDTRPVNLRGRTLISRVAGKKHNWLPIQVSFVKMYPGFPQNPGW